MNIPDHLLRVEEFSLKDRIKEYKEALEASRGVLESMKLSDDASWAERLGSRDDVLEAKNIIEQSLARVTASISLEELKEAVSSGYLSDAEAKVFVTHKAEQEFKQTTQDKASYSSTGKQSQ